MDEWIKKMWYTHNGMLLGHKNDEILPFAIILKEFDGITLSEISQMEKDKYHMISLPCGILKINK